MNCIRRIEIKNFRSIQHIVIEKEIKNLNIFVGNNDIGKSNILRALNLFFNNQTDIGKPLNFWEDFNKNIQRTSGKGQYIKITLDIELKYENNKYVRWSKQWDNNGNLKTNTKDVYDFDNIPDDFLYNSRAKGWLEKIKFRYIPAVKSTHYFQHLYEELHDLLSSSYSEQFKQNTESLIESIQSITNDITQELLNSLSIENRISISTDLKSFFSSLDFTSENNGRKFGLEKRGDGIKARHIPIILRFMASKAKVPRKGALDIQTVWGFEEPENNLEMSHAFELAETFYNYCSDIQMFITTHSPAFYSLKSKTLKVSCWLTKRNVFNHTELILVNDSVDLDQEMGMLHYITPFLQQKNNEIARHVSEITTLTSELNSIGASSKVIVFTEDEDLTSITEYLEFHEYNLHETKFYSYSGKDNFNSALITADFIKSKFSNIKYFVFYRDKDIDWEHFIQKIQPKLNLRNRENYILFTSTGYDFESVFINAQHIHSLYPSISLEQADAIIEESTNEAESKSMEKLNNSYLRYRVGQELNKGISSKDINYTSLYNEVRQKYINDKIRYRYGKKVLGVITSRIQQLVGQNVDLKKPTVIIQNQELIAIKNIVWP